MQDFFCEPHRQISFLCQEEHKFTPHFHHTIEIIFVEDGYSSININGIAYDVSAGSVLFIPQNAIHSGLTPTSKCNSYVLITDPNWLHGAATKLASHTPVYPIWNNPHKVSIIWPILRHLWENLSTISTDTFTSLISSVICVILDDVELQKVTSSARAEQRILNYCQNHYLEPITVNDVASALGLSCSYISHVFSGTLKTSFPAYINGLRLFDSMILLEETNLPITSVSDKAGFSTLRTFNRVFQELTGHTPVQWRKDHSRMAMSNHTVISNKSADSV